MAIKNGLSMNNKKSNLVENEFKEYSIYEISEEQWIELRKLEFKDSRFSGLRAICAKEKLPPAAFTVLVWRVIEIADFKRSYQPKMKSERQQLDSLIAVEKAGLALRAALEDLDSGDFMSLNFHLGWAGKDLVAATNTDPVFSRAIAAQRAACAVAFGARRMHSDLIDKGANGLGRVKTVGSYAGFIAAIALQLEPYGVIPGDGGPFRRLCDEVFSVADLPTTSQAAIKYFLKNMKPGLLERGYVFAVKKCN